MSFASERLRIVLGFIIITLVWSSTWLVIKVGLSSIPPFYGVAFRFSFAWILLSLVMFLRKERLTFDRDSMLLFFVLGVFSFCIPFSLLYWAEETIPSGLASVLFAVYPFIVAVVSHFVLPDEPMTATKIMGIASAFIGVLVIFWADLSLGGVSMLGMLAVLVCTLLQGSILVYVKKKGHHIPAVSLNVGGMIFGVPVMYLLAFIFDDFSKVHLDARGIFSFCYLGAFGTVVAFVIYYWLLKRVEAVFVSLVTFVTPVFAIILGALILGEKLGPRDLLGALLVLLGILISNSRDIVKAIQAKHAQTFAVAQKEQL